MREYEQFISSTTPSVTLDQKSGQVVECRHSRTLGNEGDNCSQSQGLQVLQIMCSVFLWWNLVFVIMYLVVHMTYMSSIYLVFVYLQFGMVGIKEPAFVRIKIDFLHFEVVEHSNSCSLPKGNAITQIPTTS